MLQLEIGSCRWRFYVVGGDLMLCVWIFKSFANFCSERLFVFARGHFSWNLKRDDANDNYISETITTIKTTYVPFGSVIIAIDESENRTRLSLTVSEIFDRKHIALNGERVISLFFFPIIIIILLLLSDVQISIRHIFDHLTPLSGEGESWIVWYRMKDILGEKRIFNFGGKIPTRWFPMRETNSLFWRLIT